MTLLTLFGKDIEKLTYDELKRERSAQQHLYRKMQSVLAREKHNNDKYALTEEQRLEARKEAEDSYNRGELTFHQYLGKLSAIEKRCTNQRYDRIVLIENYIKNLEAFVKDIDYYVSRRTEPMSRASRRRSMQSIRERNAKMRKEVIKENARAYQWKQSIVRDGFLVSWDKARFLMIAADRGYQTDSAIIQAVAEELRLDRTRGRMIIDYGRFTWGQVLCLGAMLEMTPKEFCDTFLVGYFTEQYGEYRASYDNISKDELLTQAIKPLATEEQ